MPWTAFIDGGARGNPGPAASGVQINDEAGRTVFLGGFILGRMTNNQAEYRGLLRSLELLQKAGARDIVVHTDSELMARQISGVYKVKSPDLRPLHEQAMGRLHEFDRFKVQHVRREKNVQADKMVNQALDAGTDVVVNDALRLAAGVAAGDEEAVFRPELMRGGSSRAGESPRSGGGSGVRSIEVRVIKPADRRVCPAAMRRGQSFFFSEIIPEGLCVEGCAAVVEAVLAMQNQDVPAGEVAGMTPQCARQGCGAVFEVRPRQNR